MSQWRQALSYLIGSERVELTSRAASASGPVLWPPDFFAGLDVLVTGAGGFVGSALCRRLVIGGVGSLVMLDSSEQNLFALQRELASVSLPCHFLLGSVGDRDLVVELLGRFRPSLLVHAAAYKHVGLLEQQLLSTVKNNTLASYELADAARTYQVKRFLLVSTDKAVRPHSVMGVSKRAAELLTLSLTRPDFRPNAIRLGNVLGSTGSVLPLLQEQLHQGRTLTVTHAEAARFFFSPEEAVSSILAAAAADVSGRVLLPVFHAPVKVVELVRSLSADAPVEFTGLRPGEKLTEEFMGPDEAAVGTTEGGLTILESGEALGRSDYERLSDCVRRRDRGGLLETLCQLVPTYVPSELVRREACAPSP